jgi:hypothetical protein
MTCGAIPIARRDRYTAWALKDEHNCLLVDPLPHQIAAAYRRLRSDPELRRHLYENAIHTFDGVTWPDQLERAYNWFTAGETNEDVGERAERARAEIVAA